MDAKTHIPTANLLNIRTELQVKKMLCSVGTAKIDYEPMSGLSQKSSPSLKP